MTERQGYGAGPGWGLVAGLGLIAAVVGWTDVTMVFIPWGYGSPEWEFGSISAAVDGLPLGTLGFGLFAAGAIEMGWRIPARIATVFAWLVAAAVIGALVIFALDVPLALRAMNPAQKPALIRAIIKTGLFCLSYIVFYVGFGIAIHRRQGAIRKGSNA